MRASALLLVVLLAGACASAEERPRTEDDARQLAPLPACLIQLGSPSKVGKGSADRAVRSLRAEQMWSLVYPGFTPERGTLAEDTRACTGRAPLQEKVVAGGTPLKVDDGAIALGGGGDRLKVAWLRTLGYPDATVGGALAMLRSVDGTAEVYAVGAYRGRAKAALTIERVGPEVVVVVKDDGCVDRKAEQKPAPKPEGCETLVSVFRPRLGVLERIASIAQERIAYATDREPGVRGLVEYRLSSSIQYVDGGIRVLEQVLVRDALAREVRKAERERAFTFAPDGSMVVDEDSLWAQVLGAVASSAPQNAR